MNLRRGSILIVVILVVAIVAVVGSYLFGKQGKTLLFKPEPTAVAETPESQPSATTSSQPELNASWKIYKNTEYHYSITNPGGFYLMATKGDASRSVIITNYNETKLTTQQIKNPIWSGKIKIDINVLSGQEGKMSSLENSMEVFYGNEKEKLKIKTNNISVGGIDGTRQEYNNGKENFAYIKLFKNNYYYLLTFTYVDPAASKDIDQILSTFKFLD